MNIVEEHYLPHNLTKILLSDRKVIVEKLKLSDLPSSCPINQMFLSFIEAVCRRIKKRFVNDEKQIKKMKDGWVRYIQGMVSLFDKALPTILLYREEEEQYEHLMLDKDFKKKLKCDIYGCKALLRLLLLLPNLLTNSDDVFLEDKSVIMTKTKALIRFLSRDSSVNLYFADEYLKN